MRGIRASCGIAAMVFLAVILGGCGFRPLYGGGGDSGSVKAALASITVPDPDTRLAQIIRNDLISTLRPPGNAAPQRYTLRVTSASQEDDSIETDTAVTVRKTVKVNVGFELLDGTSGPVVFSGKTFSQASYDRTGRSFADLQAQTNALERAAHEVSQDIRTRLAAHFAAG